MKKVKCVYNAGVERFLELGSEYFAEDRNDNTYNIRKTFKRGLTSIYFEHIGIFTKDLFIDVPETKEEIKQELHKKIETVNHPSHYNKNGIEAIDVIEAFNLNFNLGNAIKYILRCESKGKKEEDLKKAIWYLNRELENKLDEEIESRR